MNAARQWMELFNPARHRAGPIGLQFAAESLNLVQLESTPVGDIDVRARASIAYPESRDALLQNPAALRAFLKKTLKKKNFHGRRVVTALPADGVRMISVTYRAADLVSDDQMIQRLMTERLEGNLTDYVIDYVPVRSGNADADRVALVAVARFTEVVEYLELLRHAGLDVEALEVGPVAIRRLVSTMAVNDDKKNVLVITFGRKTSYMTMVSERRLLFDQEIKFGEDRFIKQVCDSLEMAPNLAKDLIIRLGLNPAAPAQASDSVLGDSGATDMLLEILKPEFGKLASEIRRGYMYAASETRGSQVDQIYILGSVARWTGSARLIDSMVDVPVAKIPDPLSLFGDRDQSVRDGEDTGNAQLAVATGLALRGVQEDG